MMQDPLDEYGIEDKFQKTIDEISSGQFAKEWPALIKN